MINSVSAYSVNNSHRNGFDDKNASKTNQTRPNLAFGYGGYYEQQSPLQGLKDLAVTLTNDMVGLFGVNAALMAMQRFVNGKVLIGKINKHVTNKITAEDNLKLDNLAGEMLKKYNLDKGPQKVTIYEGPPGEAYYTHQRNKFVNPNSIVVGRDNCSSLFHEIGHAIEENKTNVLKRLQRFRGHYTELSLALYMLMSMRPKKNDYYQDENQGIGAKIKHFLSHSDAVIPLLAFAPELITEAKASLYGLKFLKGKLGKEALLYKNIRKSYITCFATYLFIPVSIMLVDAIRNSANKAVQRRQAARNQYY